MLATSLRSRASRTTSPANWEKGIGLETFSETVRENLEAWRKTNDGSALVALDGAYPKETEFHCVTERAFGWFEDYPDADNVFYLADLVDTEQLAGIAAELKIDTRPESREDITAFLRDCQWMMNRYVFSLILEAEKSYSGEGPSYPEAYFSKDRKTYPMLDQLIDS